MTEKSYGKGKSWENWVCTAPGHSYTQEAYRRPRGRSGDSPPLSSALSASCAKVRMAIACCHRGQTKPLGYLVEAGIC